MRQDDIISISVDKDGNTVHRVGGTHLRKMRDVLTVVDRIPENIVTEEREALSVALVNFLRAVDPPAEAPAE
jgi:hypothetical protein